MTINMEQVKAVILDIGNVLVDFCDDEFFGQFVTCVEDRERLMNASLRTPVWLEFDRGVWSDEEILQGFIEHDPEFKTIIRNMFASMEGVIRMRDFAIPWIESLKSRGYQVIALSNFPKKLREDCAEDMRFLHHMTGEIMSYREKMVKPNQEIYELLLERYGLKASECFFIDDVPANIQMAKELGFQAICVEDQGLLLELVDMTSQGVVSI